MGVGVGSGVGLGVGSGVGLGVDCVGRGVGAANVGKGVGKGVGEIEGEKVGSPARAALGNSGPVSGTVMITGATHADKTSRRVTPPLESSRASALSAVLSVSVFVTPAFARRAFNSSMSCFLVFLESFMSFPLSRRCQHIDVAAGILAWSGKPVNPIFRMLAEYALP